MSAVPRQHRGGIESSCARPGRGRARRAAAVLALAALAGVAASAATSGAADADKALARRLAAVLDERALRGARIGALVVDDADGRVLFEHLPDRALVPASNLKILTAVASLRAFGPAHRFTTEVASDAPPDDSGAVGTLYVKGGGDPGLTSEDLWRLAADLRREGLRRVEGALVVDDSLFDGQRWHPSWLPVSSRAYHAPIGAFTVNYGAFAVVVTSGEKAGDPVQVVVDPPVDLLRVANRARTGPPGSHRRLVVDRRERAGGEEVVVGGSWPLGATDTFHRSVIDPAAYAASVLRLQLAAVGIDVQGPTRRGYLPPEAHPILSFEGRPVSDVVRRFLKYSSNPIGEGLVKALAVQAGSVPGSWEEGSRAMREQLEKLRLPLDGLVLIDGSGLSYHDRVTPRLLVAALRRGSRSFRFGAEFVAGLPIAGADGTLAERAEEASRWVRAKTGLLTRVTCLSGFARRADGSTAVFSVLVNGFRGTAQSAMDALDDFATALADGAGDQDERPPAS